MKSFAAGTYGISLLDRDSVEGIPWQKERYESRAAHCTPSCHSLCLSKAAQRCLETLGCSDGVKDNLRAGMETNGMERKQVILDYFSRALTKQPAGPHTDTSSHRPVKTSVGETTSCSKIPSLPIWATTALSSPGETPCRSFGWCHRAVLHISCKTHCLGCCC